LGRLAAIVLGSAAGGGFPQWNCRCPTCLLAWAGDLRVRPRTQASLAVSGNATDWVLLNASPDLPQQIRRHKSLHPRSGIRDSPIKSVVLTGAAIDQVAGLLSLRERGAFTIFATSASLDALAANSVFGVLAPELVLRRAVSPGEPFDLPGGLAAQLFCVPGKVPLYLEGETAQPASDSEANVGIEISVGHACLIYVPGAAAVSPAMIERFARADVVFFDGTLFEDDEMIRNGTGDKTGRRMGHMPIDGEGGSLALLEGVTARRIFVHINNTNPILIDGSPQRTSLQRRGWEIAEDGMEIML
jgi:pyrroloquinoline quinone biosynthesis protein B